MSRSTDRDLLFGLLALQNNFIDRDALVDAFHRWTGDRSQPLDRVLLDRGALSPSLHALLTGLVEEHIKRHGGDTERSLAALSSIGSAREDLARIADPDLHASLAHVSAACQTPEADPYRTVTEGIVGESTSAGSRFHILRPHAKGGLGQVSVALDRELDRPVALKELQDLHADEPHSRARFVQEAEITGKLEHPGIIPVYGLGHDATGRPFYAMRFIKGDSLKEAIAAFHGDEGLKKDPAARMSRLRDLLRRFTDVCNAIAYAHSRGVLHRDLKPGNIMLGPYNETLVVNWGLAKSVGDTSPGEGDAAPTTSPVEGPIRLSGLSGSAAETVAGSPIGTPAFASPEQVTGATDRLGPATDIYGLGATLYALLTGRPPVASNDLGEVIRRVERGEIPPPRSIDPTIPRPLEAICRKAMATDPAGRYVSARALATDVTRWLDDEPVSADREPFAERARRWTRRHRVALAWASTLLLTLLLGSVAAVSVCVAYRMDRLRRTAEGARSLALTERDRASTERDRADQARQGEADARAKEAETKEVLRLRLVQKVDIANGVKLMDQGDLFGSIAWFADAHRLELGDRESEDRLRSRVNAVLQHGPKLSQVLFHAGEVNHAEFSPDGRRILTASEDKTARVWDVDTGQPVAPPMKHDGTLWRAAFSPDGRRVLTASGDKTARVWDAANGQPLAPPMRHEGAVPHAAFSIDGRRILTASLDGTARVWDAANGQPLAPPMTHASGVMHAAFSPDGRRVLTASEDKTARVWDAANGQPLTPPMTHASDLIHAAFSPDGRRIVTASEDKTARVWDAANGQPLTPPMTHEGAVLHAAFSPDGRRLVTASWDFTARVWDAANGQPLAPPMRHGLGVRHAAFSPDGRRVLTASRDKTARVWDAATGQALAPPLKHDKEVFHAEFSPDGRRVLTASEDKTARVWDAANGQPLAPPMTHGFGVMHAEFSPDGRRVVTASLDKTARVWDAATGQPVAPREDNAKDLIALAHLLSGMKVDRSGDLVPFMRDELRAAWQDLGPRYPEVFVCSPQEILSWHWREAAGCEDSGAGAGAVIHLDALIEADPESWMLLGRRGRAYAQLGRWNEAIADASKAIALRPEPDQLWKLQKLWLLRGNAHAELGRWEQAAADLTRAIEQDAGDPDPQIDLARVHLARGDIAGYRRVCTRPLREFGRRNNPYIANNVAWTCSLTSDAVEDREAVVRFARAAAKAASTDSDKHSFLNTLGAATYRAGRFEEAIGHLNDAMKALPEPGRPQLKPDPAALGRVSSGPIAGGEALDWIFLAMAHHRLGHAEEARKWLDKTVASIDRSAQDPPDGTSPDSRIDWKTRLEYRVLRHEAEDLIGQAGAAHPRAAGAEAAGRPAKSP